MKRDPSLVPLSHDHHHGLVMAMRLKRGHSQAPRSDWPEERRAQAERLVHFYQDNLVEHFEVEERLVFPLFEKLAPDRKELTEGLRSDHHWFGEQVQSLPVDEIHLEDVLVSFGVRLEEHIRTEERQLFELLQQHASAKELSLLGKRIESSRKD